MGRTGGRFAEAQALFAGQGVAQLVDRTESPTVAILTSTTSIATPSSPHQFL
jgi:hypothetical protein